MADQIDQKHIALEQAPEDHEPTATEQLELERARTERIAAETRLIELQKQLDAAENDRRELNRNQAIKKAFEDSRVRFHDRDVALDVVEKMYGVEYDAHGNPSGLIDKKRQPLHKVLQHFALNHPTMADGRSLKALKEAEPQLKSRADMTPAEKAKFISEHGQEEYLKLPLKQVPQGPDVPQTWEQYKALPLAQRSRLAGKFGEEWVSSLMRKK